MELSKKEVLLIIKLMTLAYTVECSDDTLDEFALAKLQEKLELSLIEESEESEESEYVVIADLSKWTKIPTFSATILMCNNDAHPLHNSVIDAKFVKFGEVLKLRILTPGGWMFTHEVISAEYVNDVFIVYVVDENDKHSYVSYNFLFQDNMNKKIKEHIRDFFGENEIWSSIKNKKKYK